MASAENRGGRFAPYNIVWVQRVAAPTRRSATPFEDGEYGTEEMILIPRASHISFIFPATSSLALSNITVLTVILVAFVKMFAHLSNAAGASDFSRKGNIHPDRE